MKRKSVRVCENDISEDQAIIAEYRNSCGSPKKLKKAVNFNVNFKDENYDDVLIAQQIHGILENIEKEDHKRKTAYKSKWRQSNVSSYDKVLVGKCEDNLETNSESKNDIVEICVNNESQGIYGRRNEDAENIVESSSSKPYKRRMVKKGNQLLNKTNALLLDDFPMTDEEKLLACPFKERRFKGMVNINRKLPYIDIRLNATDVHDIFIKWEVQLRNNQRKYGRILKSTRAILPTSTGDEELLQTSSTQCHNNLLLPSTATNQCVFDNTSMRKESDTEADLRKNETRTIHKKSRLRPFREKFKEYSRKSNRSRKNHEQANDTILLENSDDETKEENTSFYGMESTKPLSYRTRRRRIASGSSDDTMATVDCKKDSCPICGILVNIKSLQAHANNCLDRSEMTSSYQGIISEDEPLPDEVLQISPKRV